MHGTSLGTSLFAVLLTSALVRADGGKVEECAGAAEIAQDLRGVGKLLDARSALRRCVQEACPANIRRDCAQWTIELETSLPTVVVAAHLHDGPDLIDVAVAVDGLPFAARLDGLARPIDPGEHRFRFTAPGRSPIEQTWVFHEGEKLRSIRVEWPSPVRPPRGAAERGSTPAPLLWALAAGGLLAVGFGGWLEATSLSEYHAMRRGCGQTGSCTQSEVNSVRTRVWIADGALVAGLASLGAGAWYGFQSIRGGALVRVAGSF